MSWRPGCLSVFALGLLVAGCESPQQKVANKEDLLAAAGFTMRPADTAQRQAQLATLPPNHFVHQDRAGRVVYLYADPLDCNCLYIGDEAAYGRYRQEVLQRNIANQQMIAAEMNQQAAWNWGAWGPGWWY